MHIQVVYFIFRKWHLMVYYIRYANGSIKCMLIMLIYLVLNPVKIVEFYKKLTFLCSYRSLTLCRCR